MIAPETPASKIVRNCATFFNKFSLYFCLQGLFMSVFLIRNDFFQIWNPNPTFQNISYPTIHGQKTNFGADTKIRPGLLQFSHIFSSEIGFGNVINIYLC
jgi:hypothetical protein